MIDFVVFGIPVGKGRPKFSTRNSRAIAYTPPKTRDYETLVQKAFREQCGQIFFEDNPLKVRITAYFPIPTTWLKAFWTLSTVLRSMTIRRFANFRCRNFTMTNQELKSQLKLC